ncbi:MAG: histidinol-phosphatase [Treponema sp.]|nr:histidinol-phosphatase [Treponema sp.]
MSLHTHTLFDDGMDDIETMCQAAYEKGLDAIGFSSHAPIEGTRFGVNWHMDKSRLAEYISEIKAARRRWEGKIAVFLGLELDYIKGIRSPLDSDIQSQCLDYIIGSVHYLAAHQNPFIIDGYVQEVEKGIEENFGGSGDAMMHAYWDAVTEMVCSGGFDIVGHLDLLKKHNAKGRWFNPESEQYLQRAEETIAAIASAGLTVEVNTGCINRKFLEEPCPSLPLLRILRRYNVPVLLSDDAHNAKDIGGNYSLARKILLEAGYEPVGLVSNFI